MMYDSIDLALKEELRGRHPSGGSKTWREYWEARIAAWRRYNNVDYENYFYRHRKELGLKDVQ